MHVVLVSCDGCECVECFSLWHTHSVPTSHASPLIFVFPTLFFSSSVPYSLPFFLSAATLLLLLTSTHSEFSSFLSCISSSPFLPTCSSFLNLDAPSFC